MRLALPPVTAPLKQPIRNGLGFARHIMKHVTRAAPERSSKIAAADKFFHNPAGIHGGSHQ
ncbi:hypothetical protein SAMN05877838_0309 [Hoeflea halophila]|uniref:Uncharacterized protein n=1 Tax=Hoeflea halophila TaxID=714899 RepID=A0A286HLA4_9HYPH|nr:hypothetical protein SAMN05877838_0309 [Hoeflea halophila]